MFGQVWNGGFFERTSLNDLGHRFYIGHQHTACPSSDSGTPTLVIDTNGVHRVNVHFCACTEDAQWVENYRQLLRIGWYPASFQRPKTAFTFNVLDTYHKLALQGKLNLYDFYSSILQMNDNCGQKKVVVSPAFSCIGILLMLATLAPVSRNVAMRSPMATSKADQARRWRPHENGPRFCPGRYICARLPSLSSPGSQSTRRLGSGSRGYPVCV